MEVRLIIWLYLTLGLSFKVKTSTWEHVQKDSNLSEWGKNSGSKEEITPVTRLDVQRKRFFQLPIDKEQRVKQSSPSKSYPHLELTEM